MLPPDAGSRREISGRQEEPFSYPKNVLWECIRCSRCCRDMAGHQRQILLLPSEVSEIHKVTGVLRESFVESTEAAPYHYKMVKGDGRCFFQDENTCAIYEHRPLICRFYPFSLRKKGSAYAFGVSDECPGLGNGKRLDRDFFLSLLRLAQTRIRATQL